MDILVVAFVVSVGTDTVDDDDDDTSDGFELYTSENGLWVMIELRDRCILANEASKRVI